MNLNLNPSPHKIKIEELKREALLKIKQNIDAVVARNKKAALERDKSKKNNQNQIRNEIANNSNFKHNWDHFTNLTQNQKAVLEAIQNVKDRCSY